MNDTIMILGGVQKEIKYIKVNGANLQIENGGDTPYIDPLDGSTSPVYWDGYYNLLSAKGVFYRIKKSTLKIKTRKDWIENTIKCGQICSVGG